MIANQLAVICLLKNHYLSYIEWNLSHVIKNYPFIFPNQKNYYCFFGVSFVRGSTVHTNEHNIDCRTTGHYDIFTGLIL